MTKKRSSEILADKNGKFFREKVTFLKFSRKSKIFSKIGGNLKQGGNASWPQGDGRPCSLCSYANTKILCTKMLSGSSAVRALLNPKLSISTGQKRFCFPKPFVVPSEILAAGYENY